MFQISVIGSKVGFGGFHRGLVMGFDGFHDGWHNNGVDVHMSQISLIRCCSGSFRLGSFPEMSITKGSFRFDSWRRDGWHNFAC